MEIVRVGSRCFVEGHSGSSCRFIITIPCTGTIIDNRTKEEITKDTIDFCFGNYDSGSYLRGLEHEV